MKIQYRGLVSRIRTAWRVWRATRQQGGIYQGTQTTRLTLDWIASILSADQEIRGSIRMLRARGRELSRNNPVAKNFLTLLANNVVGPKGIDYKPQVRNANGNLNTQLNQKIKAAWTDWCKKGNCTADGKLSLRALCDLVIRNIATDGEAFIRQVPGFPGNACKFALQLIDPDQVDPYMFQYPANVGPQKRGENEVRFGIEIDEWGRPVAYWVTKGHPSDLGGSLDAERIGAEYITHLYDPHRVNQTRGITWFAAVMFELRMLGGYIEAELVAARTGAAKMGFLKYTDASTFQAESPEKPFRMDAQPGVIETLPPGLEFQEWSPDHPAAAFPNFVITLLRQVATGLGVSYNALASDLTGVNYSSMRSGLLIERDLWRRLQQWLIESFLQPTFESWLKMALLSGELVLDSRDPSKFLAGKWEPRGWQWVDPLKDVQAAILGIGAGLTSRDAVVSEKGEDVEEIFEALKEEQELADEYEIEIATIAKPPKVSKGEGETVGEEDAGEAAGGDGTTEKKSARKLIALARGKS
jgi:lambda family phage portal protein